MTHEDAHSLIGDGDGDCYVARLPAWCVAMHGGFKLAKDCATRTASVKVSHDTKERSCLC